MKIGLYDSEGVSPHDELIETFGIMIAGMNVTIEDRDRLTLITSTKPEPVLEDGHWVIRL